MLLKLAGFTFVFIITVSLVFSSLYVNYQPVSAQIFEFQEEDYFDVNEGDGSQTLASTKDDDEDDDDDEDEDEEDSPQQVSKKKKKKGEDNADSQNNNEPTYDLTESDVQKYYVQKY